MKCIGAYENDFSVFTAALRPWSAANRLSASVTGAFSLRPLLKPPQESVASRSIPRRAAQLEGGVIGSHQCLHLAPRNCHQPF